MSMRIPTSSNDLPHLPRRLRQLCRLQPLSQDHAFRSHNAFYPVRWTKEDGQIFMHNDIIRDVPNGCVVDHVNRDPLDHRRSNLRIISTEQNYWNRAKRPGRLGVPTKSKYIGVFLFKGRWRAAIQNHGKRDYLGYFDTEEQAARVYNERCLETRGDLAVLNDVPLAA